MSENWIKHDGGECPVAATVLVEIMYPFGDNGYGPAGQFRWAWDFNGVAGGDIVGYRLVEDKQESSTVKSDGSNTSYYDIIVENRDGEAIECQANDIFYALVGGDTDLSNIIKACRRMYEHVQGRGKEGIDLTYDANKIKWFVDDYVRRFGNA